MANILYLSCHTILEYNEVKLLTEIGHEVFPLGAYNSRGESAETKRPAIPGMRYNEEMEHLAVRYSKENLHPEMIEPFDVIMVMHIPDWIQLNWEKIKHKKVVWRSIGQSCVGIETQLKEFRGQGLKIVRYSPLERGIRNYVGEDVLIRFYGDPEEWSGWNGNNDRVITIGQSINKDTRRDACRYDVFEAATVGFPRVVYGPGNQDVGELWGGLLSYDELKAAYRDNRVFFYTGTQPSSYTLGFIEAFMTGIPIVAIGKELGQSWIRESTYEVPFIIKDGVNGFCSDDIGTLKDDVSLLLRDKEEARKIGEAGRKTAIELFGKEMIKDQWKTFLEKIC